MNELVHFQETRINTPARIVPTLEDKISDYPTPTRDYINIDAKVNKLIRINAELYDMTGRMVENHHENAYFNFKERLDVRNLKSDTYILQIRKEGQRQVFVIMKN